MTTELKWTIGKEGGTPLDRPPFRAYFYRIEDGQLVASSDFSASELRAEIARLRGVGEDIAPFEDALKQLLRNIETRRSLFA